MEDSKVADSRAVDGIDSDKRDFMKKVLIGTAFAIPIIQSVDLEENEMKLPSAFAS